MDDDQTSNVMGSAALNLQKSRPASTGPRRSQRENSGPKLQTYADVENAEIPSSRGDESRAPSDQRMSDQGEDISNSTTRKKQNAMTAGDGDRSDSELSSVDTGILSDAGFEQDTSNKTNRENGNDVWKILDNDLRTPLERGVEAPNRLVLRFQNHNTNEIREYKYKETEIDWTNDGHIAAVNKWRGQIFWRLKFSVREAPRWSMEETAFLTLVYEKLELAVEQNKRLTLPSLVTIFKIFNEEFEGTRSLDSFCSQFRRKAGIPLTELKTRVDNRDAESVADGGPEYLLNIAPGEVDAYVKHKYVSLAFDTAEYQVFVNSAPAVKKVSKAKQTTKELPSMTRSAQTQPPKKPAVTTGRIVKTQKTQTNGRVSRLSGESKSKTLANKAVPISPDVDKPTRNGDSRAFGHVIVEGSNIRSAPLERLTSTDHPVAARNAQLSSITGQLATYGASLSTQPSAAIPTKTQDPAMQSVPLPDRQESSLPAPRWIVQAGVNLRERIERLGERVGLIQDTDRNALRAEWFSDPADIEHRVVGAPEVNALLNAAIVPPVGFKGDVLDLVKEKALPADQLHLHEQSVSALRTYHTANDQKHDSRDSSSTNMQSDEVVSSLETEQSNESSVT